MLANSLRTNLIFRAENEDLAPLVENVSDAFFECTGITDELVLQVEDGHFSYIARGTARVVFHVVSDRCRVRCRRWEEGRRSDDQVVLEDGYRRFCAYMSVERFGPSGS